MICILEPTLNAPSEPSFNEHKPGHGKLFHTNSTLLKKEIYFNRLQKVFHPLFFFRTLVTLLVYFCVDPMGMLTF